MTLNPRFKISIQIEKGQEEWLDVMKQEFKNRIIEGPYDYFQIIEDKRENLTISFIPRYYIKQKELLKSFEENVLESVRRIATKKQA